MAGIRWTERRGLPRLTSAVAVVSTGLGLALLATLRAGDPATQSGRAFIGGLLLLAGTFILAGIQVAPSQPRVGAALRIAPVLLLGLLLWSTIVAPLLSAAIAWSVIRNARAGKGSGAEP